MQFHLNFRAPSPAAAVRIRRPVLRDRKGRLTIRSLADDARWDDSRPHFMRMIKRLSSEFPYPQLGTGESMDDPLFPVVWERSLQRA